MTVPVLVPAKAFERAKTRLESELGQAGRVRLAEQMLSHVLEVLGEAPSVEDVTVATDSERVAALARQAGAEVVFDQDAEGLGAVVDAGLRQLRGPAALVLMADLPTLRVAEVEKLLARRREAPLVIAPDRHRHNTNALVLPLPAEPTRFGQPKSFELHLADARSRGVSVALHDSPGLALDLDDASDFLVWRGQLTIALGE